MNAMHEYRRAVDARNQIISENSARRMRGKGQPPLPVPPRPAHPLVPVAYEADGTFAGRLQRAEDCPRGCVVKMEPAIY